MNNEVLPKDSAFRAGLRSCRRPGQLVVASAVAAALILGGANAATAVSPAVSATEGSFNGGDTTVVNVNGMSFTKVFTNDISLASFGVTDDGVLYGWGWNNNGQLGIGGTTNQTVPTPVATAGTPMAGKTITQVASGEAATVALASDGTLYSWGSGANGRLGNGTTTDTQKPVAVTMTGALAGKTIVQVTSDRASFFALASDGTVFSWGFNNVGQLGTGATGDQSSPVAVNMGGALFGKTVVQIESGNHSTTALTSDGQVFTWGYNSQGQLGTGDKTDRTSPVPVVTAGTPMAGKTIKQVSTGGDFALALATDGTVYSWGVGTVGQLGNATSNSSLVPVAVTASGALAGKTVTNVIAGNTSAYAITNDGLIAAWGDDSANQLGDGGGYNFANQPVFVTSSGALKGKTISSVAGSVSGAAVVASDGTTYAWGSNNAGQLGNGSGGAVNASTPVAGSVPAVGVTFGGTAATNVTRINANQVSVVTPAHATGLVDVVATAGGNASFLSTTTTAPQAFRYVVAPSITTSSLAAPVVGKAYSDKVSSSGTGTITFSISSGSLPVGLSLNSATGAITGTPTTSGSSSFVVTATNASGSNSRSFTLGTLTAPTISTTSLGDAGLDADYNASVDASGSGPLSFAVSAGSLPAGLNLDSATGVVSGRASQTGSYTFAISATNSGGSQSKTFTINVLSAPEISTSVLGDAIIGSAYVNSIDAVGSGAISYAVTDGALPAGLSLNAKTGVISGTATAEASSIFTVTASNAEGSDSAQYTLVTRSKPVLSASGINDGIVGTAYSQQVSATGSGTLSYQVVSGALPVGVTLDPATGILSGTPTASGTAMFAIEVSSQYGTDTEIFSATVHTPPTVTTTSVDDGTVGKSYSQSIAATGEGTLSYTMSSGSLPAGLTLNTATGAITGTPTDGGTSTFTITVVNAFGSASKTYTATVHTPPTISTGTVASGTVRKAYAQTIVASGEGMLSYAVTKGALPKGLVLNKATGAITGTPTNSGTSTYTVTVTNKFGSIAKAFTVKVAAAKLTASVPAGKKKAGSKVVVTVAGLENGETATLKLGTTNYGTVKANTAGVAKKTVVLNAKLKPAKYTITVTGNKHGKTTAKAAVTVVKK